MTYRRKVLLVDDHEIVHIMVKNMLGQERFEFVTAKNGEDAAALLTSDAAIALVICDYHMPVLDGLEFIKLKAIMENHRATPVIMVTSNHSAKLKDECATLGVMLLAKPFKKEALRAAVDAALSVGSPSVAEGTILGHGGG